LMADPASASWRAHPSGHATAQGAFIGGCSTRCGGSKAKHSAPPRCRASAAVRSAALSPSDCTAEDIRLALMASAGGHGVRLCRRAVAAGCAYHRRCAVPALPPPPRLRIRASWCGRGR
jgi:hypothetical protein